MNRITGTILGAAALLLGVACQQQSPSETAAPKVTEGAARADGTCAPGLSVAPDAPVAKVGGEVITCAQLYEKDKAAVQQAESQFMEQAHQIHSQSLQQLIDDRLMEAAAKKAGKTKEEWIEAEAKAEAPTEEEMKQLYEMTAARGQQLPPFEQIKGDIQEYLTQQKQQQKLGEIRQKLREEASVEVMLPPHLPPKVAVEAVGPSKGPESAPVTIVEFSDFQCPFCSRAEPTIEKVLETYGDKVRLVYRDYPLPNHTDAPKASEAALCAQDQGKYWEMHAKLFENQQALGVPQLKTYAGELGLDQAKFDACLESGEKAEIVTASFKAGEEAGVSGTPAFFINGRLVSGAQPFERFKEIIDHELAQAAN